MSIFLLKLVASVFALTLFAFASLQLNDPDPIMWAGFYILCALVPLLLVFNIYYASLFWAALAACVAQLCVAGPGAFEYSRYMAQEALMQAMNPDKPYIEEAREFSGVLIALVCITLSAGVIRTYAIKRSLPSDINRDKFPTE